MTATTGSKYKSVALIVPARSRINQEATDAMTAKDSKMKAALTRNGNSGSSARSKRLLDDAISTEFT